MEDKLLERLDRLEDRLKTHVEITHTILKTLRTHIYNSSLNTMADFLMDAEEMLEQLTQGGQKK